MLALDQVSASKQEGEGDGGAGAGEEASFTRFQNTGVPGTYLYATGEEATNIQANFPGFIDEGIAFEAEI